MSYPFICRKKGRDGKICGQQKDSLLPLCLYNKIFLTFLLMITVCALCTAVLFHIIFSRLVTADRYRMLDEAPSHLDNLPRLENGILVFDLPMVSEIYGLEYVIFSADGQVLATQGGLCADAEEMVECLAEEHVYVVPVALGDTGEVAMFAATDHPLDEPQEKKLFLVGLAVICGVAALFTFKLARRITSPLTGLNDAVNSFAAGDLSTRVVPMGPKEVQELSCTFNVMADSIERNIKGHKELTANVSHELRSPLARIRIIQELLSDRLAHVSDEKVIKLLGDMGGEIVVMDQLIGGILSLSRMDAMNTFTSKEELDLRDMVHESLQKNALQIQGCNLVTVIRMPRSCPILGNRHSLFSMVNNVLSNAIKYSPQGDTIRISLHVDDEQSVLEIENTASYTEDTDFESLCEPFIRLGAPSTTGFGLGLAIARRAARHNGGVLSVSRGTKGFLVRIIFQ